MKIIFYKYRKNFSAGLGNWEYAYTTDDVLKSWGCSFKEYFKLHHNFERAYAWSEHYRGYDVRVIKNPPREWLERQIDSQWARAKRAKLEATTLNSINRAQIKERQMK